MDLGLSGKRFAVTGGTRGIGRAVVEGLLNEGAAVAYCARTPEAVSEAQAELTADGVVAVGTAVDVGDAAALTAWVNAAADAFGGLDGVVANVSALAIPESVENWRTSFDVDLMGTVGLVDAALPHFLAAGGGSIVTISSVSGREVDFAAGPYGTMKAAIIQCEPPPIINRSIATGSAEPAELRVELDDPVDLGEVLATTRQAGPHHVGLGPEAAHVEHGRSR